MKKKLMHVTLLVIIAVALSGCTSEFRHRPSSIADFASEESAFEPEQATVIGELGTDEMYAAHYNVEVVDITKDDSSHPPFMQTDYIYVTNANRALEPIQIRQGDEFLGLILEELDFASVSYIDGDLYKQEAYLVNFVGDMILSGNWMVSMGGGIVDYYNYFVVHESDLELIPVLVSMHYKDDIMRQYNAGNISFRIEPWGTTIEEILVNGWFWFNINNPDYLLELLLKTYEDEIPNDGWLYFNNITIKVPGISLANFHIGPSATVSQIIFTEDN